MFATERVACRSASSRPIAPAPVVVVSLVLQIFLAVTLVVLMFDLGFELDFIIHVDCDVLSTGLRTASGLC